MDQNYTLGLSLLDFVPNLAFLINGYFLVHLVRLTNRTFAVNAMFLGTSLVFIGGTLKAIWKLFYTLKIGDFQLLSELQFFLFAPGFLSMFISAIFFIRFLKKEEKTGINTFVSWKIPLLITFTISSLGVQVVLIYLAFRRNAYFSAALTFISILLLLAMAALARGEQTVPKQWLEEGINSGAQISWAIGSYLLFKKYS